MYYIGSTRSGIGACKFVLDNLKQIVYYSSSSMGVDNLSIKQRYDEVIKILNTLQSNASVLSKIKPGHSCQFKNIEYSQKYLKRCNIDLNRLKGKVIHVTGTKGKGSTCALIEAILRSHNYTTGFYSSPHLFSVTERIRINGVPLSYEKFVDYFWDIYNTLDNNKDDANDIPSYFKFLTVLAFKVFICENVDVAIVEVGIGGEYDCTNTLRNTSVAGVTSLGYDHLSVLGNTIEEIAWNKGGIMKEGCEAFTCSDQPVVALEVLKQRAEEKNCTLHIIDRNKDLGFFHSNKLLELNGSLAVHLAHAWMQVKKGLKINLNSFSDQIFPLDKRTRAGLEGCLWPGRFQIVPRGEITMYLDGAHTCESMMLCSQWFNKSAPTSEKRVLIFNITGSRDPHPILKILAECNFDFAFFCPNLLNSEPLYDNETSNCLKRGMSSQRNASVWFDICKQEGKVFGSVNETFSALSALNCGPLHVLVTGSLHLVGNTTCFLQPDLWTNNNNL